MKKPLFAIGGWLLAILYLLIIVVFVGGTIWVMIDPPRNPYAPISSEQESDPIPDFGDEPIQGCWQGGAC